jgi:hypothetical protein
LGCSCSSGAAPVAFSKIAKVKKKTPEILSEAAIVESGNGDGQINIRRAIS